MKTIILSALLLLPACVMAQTYSIDWHKIAGGGGTATGGVYSVTGTIGQADAGGAMSGGNYSVTGGFWSLINVVQTPGVPNLIIAHSGANSVKILWLDQATNTFTLQQRASVATGTWATSGFTITSAGGTNSVTITPPTGSLFFRLKR